ncbi:hypothetical protein AOQ72_04210 [Bradyrhizobium yuanmingense]|uniref:Uncharacterized protein n=1 Tax=Bradyrhizobium yuanmingense TaxID=108015 RepID=A0A0R3BKB7_9BRAD|nr:hypothetical protein AOQ72_04210 [Bradyrhizobium yuanmingense]
MDDLDDLLSTELRTSQRKRCASIAAAPVAMPFVAAYAVCLFVDALPFIPGAVRAVNDLPRYGRATFAPSRVFCREKSQATTHE